MPVSKNRRKDGTTSKSSKKYRQEKKVNLKEKFLDELKDIRMSCNGLILETTNIRHVIKVAGSSKYVDLDIEEVNKNVQILSKDLEFFKEELERINTEADEEVAKIKNFPDELDLLNATINLAQAYDEWKDKFIRTTSPTVEVITELCVKEKESENAN